LAARGLYMIYKALKSVKGAAPLLKYFNPGNPTKFKKAAFSFMQWVKGGAYGGKMSAMLKTTQEAPKWAKQILKFRGQKPTAENIRKIYDEMYSQGKMLSLEGSKARLANFDKARTAYRKPAKKVLEDLKKRRGYESFVEDSERATEPFAEYLNLDNRYKAETYKYYAKVTRGKTPKQLGTDVVEGAGRTGIKADESFSLIDMATAGSNRPTELGLELGGKFKRYAKSDPRYPNVILKAYQNLKQGEPYTRGMQKVAIEDFTKASYSPKFTQFRGPNIGKQVPNRSDQVLGGHNVTLDFKAGTSTQPKLTVFDRTDLGTSSLDRFLEGTDLFNKVLIRAKL
jgi:hypothetical protein